MNYDVDALERCREYRIAMYNEIGAFENEPHKLVNLVVTIQKLYELAKYVGCDGYCSISNPSDCSVVVEGAVDAKTTSLRGVEIKKTAIIYADISLGFWKRDLERLADDLVVGCYHITKNCQDNPDKLFDPVKQLTAVE